MHDWDRLLGPKISNTVEKLLCESHERGRRITVLSSLDEIFMYQLGIMVGVILRPPYSFLQQASGQIFKDDVNGFPSISDICFLGESPCINFLLRECVTNYIPIMHD